MTVTLSKTETRILLEAAERGGAVLFSEATKQITRERMLGRFEAEGLIVAGGSDGTEPLLTGAGYKSVGLRAPRKKSVAPARPVIDAGTQASEAKPTSKKNLIADMLAREDGASLAELMQATGWLAHTTRAALSRIRASGRTLAKSPRPDGKAAYKLEAAA